MDAATRAWLIAQLGTATPLPDLEARFTRLGKARAVALEVLGERLAAFIAQPTTVNVSGVVSVSFSANIAALQKQIADLRNGQPVAPDEDDPDGDGIAGDNGFGVILLRERPRR
ncbi:hypothetical protein [Streptomyces sp. AcH 505]|uniref:hypothetical protein n=1 Tax=Streptomyces sp. AcH 505 TaxID=352211 RepID=UPI000695049E